MTDDKTTTVATVEAKPNCAPVPGYETAIFQLTSAADDRDKTAAKLRDWADEEHPGQKRTEQLTSVLDQLWREANELRAAAQVLQSHNVPDQRPGESPKTL